MAQGGGGVVAWGRRFRARAPAALLAAQAAAVVAVCLDLAIGPGRPPWSAAVFVRVAAGGLALGLATGAVAGLAAALLAAIPTRLPDPWTAYAAATAAATWLAYHDRMLRAVTRRFHDPLAMALLLVVGALALAAAASLLLLAGRRLLARAAAAVAARWPSVAPPLAAAPLALAAAVAAREVAADRAQSAPWRALLLGCVAGLAALLVVVLLAARARAAPPADPRRRRALLLAAALLTVAAFPVALGRIADHPLLQRGRLVPAITRLVRPLLDRDGDGALALLGDGDCAEGDAARAPTAVEIPDDGVDQDCRFGDLRRFAAPEARPAAAPAADTVLLLTIGGLPPADLRSAEPKLPRLAARARDATSFSNPLGVEGRFRHVAAILLGGRLPGAGDQPGAGFRSAAPNLPMLAARAGWSVGAVTSQRVRLDKLTTTMPPEAMRMSRDPAAAPAMLFKLLPEQGRAFLWVHLELTDKGGSAAVDQAIDRLIAKLEKRGHVRILVVATTNDRPTWHPRLVGAGDRPRGGPVALLGDGVPRRVVGAPVGMFDVYPTLLELTGLTGGGDPRGELPQPGRSLVEPPAGGPVLAGWLGSRIILAAFDDREVVSLDSLRRRFEVRGPGGAATVPEAAGDARADDAVRLLRDGFWAPRLRWRNQLLAEARAPLPADLGGKHAVIGDALQVLGCSAQPLGDDRLLVTLGLRRGERLRPGDLLEVRLRGAGIRLISQLEPFEGAYPFGTWEPGVPVAQQVTFDTRLLPKTTWIVWVAVVRDGKRLPVTAGEGVSWNGVPVCVVP